MQTVPEVSDKAANKNATIRQILENDTYMPESGMVQNLHSALNRLSQSDLDNLNLIIQIKMGNL